MLALMHEQMDHPLRRMLRKLRGGDRKKVGAVLLYRTLRHIAVHRMLYSTLRHIAVHCTAHCTAHCTTHCMSHCSTVCCGAVDRTLFARALVVM
jgi:hypothetical protein